MTTYRNIANSEVAIDAPLTQQLMQALKDNPLAIAEGDSQAIALGKIISTTSGALAARATSSSHTGGFRVALLQTIGVVNEPQMDTDTESNNYAPVYRVGRSGTYLVQFGVHLDSVVDDPNMTWNVQVDTGSGFAIDTDLQFTSVQQGDGFLTANKVMTLSVGNRVRLNGKYTSGSSPDRQDIDARVALFVDNPLEFGGGYMMQIKSTLSYSSSGGQTFSQTTELVDNGGVQTGLFTIPQP